MADDAIEVRRKLLCAERDDLESKIRAASQKLGAALLDAGETANAGELRFLDSRIHAAGGTGYDGTGIIKQWQERLTMVLKEIEELPFESNNQIVIGHDVLGADISQKPTDIY